jgi:hypothetical protein
VGDHRLAFAASDVATVEPRSDGQGMLPSARRAFALSDQPGRVLIAPSGEAVVVDSLEVVQGEVVVIARPLALHANSGGSLHGFVIAREQLWPLLGVAAFSRFLNALPRAEAVPSVGTERF